jgi:hypothetical protein
MFSGFWSAKVSGKQGLALNLSSGQIKSGLPGSRSRSLPHRTASLRTIQTSSASNWHHPLARHHGTRSQDAAGFFVFQSKSIGDVGNALRVYFSVMYILVFC